MNSGKKILLLSLVTLFCFLLGVKNVTQGATVTCPKYSAVLEGSSQMPMGFSYSSRIELHKLNNRPGYNGKWKVDRLVQINNYPHNIEKTTGPIHYSTKVYFAVGMWMQCEANSHVNQMENVCHGGNTILDVSGRKIGSVKTDTWVGKIKGNVMTIRFDKNNPFSPEMTGKIDEVKSGKLDLTITSPAPSSRYLFSETTSGKFEAVLKARVKPPSYQKEIQWRVFNLQNSSRTITPQDAKGPVVKAEFKGLPLKNSEFGKKKITASVKIGACTVTEDVEVYLYYPKFAHNNPDGKVPNWFYYWSQTKARKGPLKYDGSKGKCAVSGSVADGMLGYYRYKKLDTHYYICNLRSLGTDFPFKMAQWKKNNLIHVKVTGIDTFAAASYHENSHYEHFKNWWFPHRAKHPFSPKEDINKNSIKDSAETKLDKDGDLLPDSEESNYNLKPTTKYSYPGPYDDEEILCWMDEAKWKIGSADKKDWSKPGKQWK